MNELLVLYQNQLVGKLTSINRILHFTYASTWLTDHNSFPLSPAIPLQDLPYQGDAVLIFFSNLLPEGPVLQALLKLKKLPSGDIFAQLNAFGEDAAGAFSITPTFSEYQPHYQLYPPEEIKKDIQKLTRKIPLFATHADLRLSLAGAQNKITVKVEADKLYLPVAGAASTHIIKPEIEPKSSIPNSVENEIFCLQLAQKCGLNVVETKILYYPEPLLLIKRYDRLFKNDSIIRVHQLDFCQLTGVLPDQKYEKDSGPSFSDIFKFIDQHSIIPGKDKLAVLDWTIFNYIIGNADAHGKNIAMLYKGNSLELAPFYDLLSTEVYDELDKKMAMAIGGEYRPKWVLTEHWKRFATEMGINFPLFRVLALHMSEKLERAIPEVLRELFPNKKIKVLDKIHKVIQLRASWLKKRLEIF